MSWDRTAGTKPIYRTSAHKRARAALLKDYAPGDPCCLCDHPMWPKPDGSTSNLHADHIPGTDQYRGLAHGSACETCGRTCNQHDGAVRGRARQTTTTLSW